MSNKMLLEPVKKTASAHRLFLLSGIVLVLAVLSLVVILRQPSNILFGNGTLQLERVSSQADVEKGLSGRTSMPEGQGMLFVFDEPGKRCFWMKDMRFPLDIIWLDADKKVVTIKENAQPSSYPSNFCPNGPAQYVIEVNAGIADRAAISEGSQLQF